MTKQEQRDQYRMTQRLEELGLNYETIQTLRRISMTLRRWFELECGDSNDHASWAITRGRMERRDGQHSGGHGPHRVFVHDDDGKPFMERHPHTSNEVHYSALPDREKGARKRLDAIMAQHPTLVAYVQTDPRGCALHILHKPGLHDGAEDLAKWAEQNYSTRGIAVW